jgi:hypothetical protein
MTDYVSDGGDQDFTPDDKYRFGGNRPPLRTAACLTLNGQPEDFL